MYPFFLVYLSMVQEMVGMGDVKNNGCQWLWQWYIARGDGGGISYIFMMVSCGDHGSRVVAAVVHYRW